jgi:hypothetical protein
MRASPHLTLMSKDDGKAAPQKGLREAKLAQALRANLRRRKAGAAAPVKPPKQS